MQTVVYGDVLFAVNFSIDLLVLSLTGYFLHLRRRLLSLLLAAILGGVYSVFFLWLSPSFWDGILLSVGMAVLLCLVAYFPIGLGTLFRLVIAFFAASVLLGGAVNALYALLESFFGTESLEGVNAVMSGKKAELFLLYALGSGLLIYIAGRFLSHRERRRRMQLEIEEGGRTVKISALVDSGNLLTDPLTSRPVILVRKKDISTLIHPAVFSILDSRYGQDRELPLSVKRKVRVIPMTGIDGGHTLVGYIPDAILVYPPEREADKYVAHAMLAVYDGKMRDFGGHAAILPDCLCR